MNEKKINPIVNFLNKNDNKICQTILLIAATLYGVVSFSCYSNIATSLSIVMEYGDISPQASAIKSILISYTAVLVIGSVFATLAVCHFMKYLEYHKEAKMEIKPCIATE